MPRFTYTGGDQRPDLFGTLEPGDVLELAHKPDWGTWEDAGSAEPGRAPTPQPAPDAELEPAPEPKADTRTRPKPNDEQKEG